MKIFALLSFLLISANVHAFGFCFAPANPALPVYDQHNVRIATISTNGDFIGSVNAEVYFGGGGDLYEVFGATGQDQGPLTISFGPAPKYDVRGIIVNHYESDEKILPLTFDAKATHKFSDPRWNYTSCYQASEN